MPRANPLLRRLATAGSLVLLVAPAASAEAQEATTPVIVTFRGAPGTAVGAVARDAGVEEVDRAFPTISAVSAAVDPEELADLQDDPRVASIERDGEVTAALDSVRTSLGIPSLAADYVATGDAAGDGLRAYGPGDVVVAVVDTGIDHAHHAVDGGKIRVAQNFSDCAASGDDWDDSTNGHGTHVAATIAGDGDVVTGIAPGAALVDLKVLCNNSGSQSSIIAALQWVLANGSAQGIDVVNLSLSIAGCGSAGTDATSRMANQVVAAGFTVVAAVGNAGRGCTAGATQQVTAPGSARWVVGVGAATEPAPTWGVASFSLHGPTGDGRIKPDVVAPGASVTSADGDVDTGVNTLQGTSMAGAVVAGVAGMLVEVHADLRPRGRACAACSSGVDDSSMVTPVLDIMRSTALDVAPAGVDEASGYGVIDPDRAFDAIVPVGNLDSARSSGRSIVVEGWAVDGRPARAVEVHVYVNGRFAGYGSADRSRPDLLALFPTAGSAHGFSLAVPGAGGSNQVCAFAIDDLDPNRSRFLGCRTVTLPTGNPFGNVEGVTRVPGGVVLGGWALDPDTTAGIEVDVWSAGRFLAFGDATQPRPDVAAAFGLGAAHGFAIPVPVGPGSHTVCAYGINVGVGTNAPIGCPTVTVSSTPIGNLDLVSRSGGTVSVQGWALDPDRSAPIEVHVLVDGRLAAYGLAAQTRTDIGSAFPAYGSSHGFAITASVAAGGHQVCIYAINEGPGYNTLLRCQSV